MSFSNISVYASILIKLPQFSNRKKLEFAILASSLRGGISSTLIRDTEFQPV